MRQWLRVAAATKIGRFRDGIMDKANKTSETDACPSGALAAKNSWDDVDIGFEVEQRRHQTRCDSSSRDDRMYGGIFAVAGNLGDSTASNTIYQVTLTRTQTAIGRERR
jgi:hypothetical protein